MDMIQVLNEYELYIKQNAYVYSLQKQCINYLYSFLNQQQYNEQSLAQYIQKLNYFLNVWIPKNKKYLTDIQAFNIAYTIQDIKVYIDKKQHLDDGSSIALDTYADEFKRLYKARGILREMTSDPVIRMEPLVIDFNNYKNYKEKKEKKQTMCMYEQGLFIIEEVSLDGYLGISKLKGGKYCKVLCRPQQLLYFREGDILHLKLKRKVFFIYWEIEELRAYYSKAAYKYL